MNPIGWVCAVCGAARPIDESSPWRCPNSTPDDHRHVLQIVTGTASVQNTAENTGKNAVGDTIGFGMASLATESPFVSFERDMAWAAYAAAHGMSEDARRSMVDELDVAVVGVDGIGFEPTPFARSDALSDALGFTPDGGVWVKNDSLSVAGSHKARHLFSILLHLRAAEQIGHLDRRAPLAIASCGNAALAAAVLARAARWPIDVFVPDWMSDVVGRRLASLGASVHRCGRVAGDPPGDPAMLRFREAVESGSIPFTVQGPENALCLDGGRTIGWEVAAQLRGMATPESTPGTTPESTSGTMMAPHRVFAQVGGGAFAACLGRGLREAGINAPLFGVQTAGCAPLARAWDRAAVRVGDPLIGRDWSALMTAWDRPHSIADGILDDETYDWLSVFAEMHASGGSPVVASEESVTEAHDLAVRAGFDVSPTGTAGLAGVLAAREDIASNERVVIVFTGVAR
jgi:threonine synthase